MSDARTVFGLGAGRVFPWVGESGSQGNARLFANPGLRASLMASQLVGLAMARHVVAIGPLAAASREELVRALTPVLDHYLRGDWVQATAPGAATAEGPATGATAR